MYIHMSILTQVRYFEQYLSKLCLRHTDDNPDSVNRVNKWTQELILSDPHQVLNIKGEDRQIQLNSHKTYHYFTGKCQQSFLTRTTPILSLVLLLILLLLFRRSATDWQTVFDGLSVIANVQCVYFLFVERERLRASKTGFWNRHHLQPHQTPPLQFSYRPFQESSVAVLRCLCVFAFICGVCVVPLFMRLCFHLWRLCCPVVCASLLSFVAFVLSRCLCVFAFICGTCVVPLFVRLCFYLWRLCCPVVCASLLSFVVFGLSRCLCVFAFICGVCVVLINSSLLLL